MAINKGVLTSKRDRKSDETYTPFYAVVPLLEFIPTNVTIWCPFDKEWSAYVQTLKEHGFNVISSHLDDGYDFFDYEPPKSSYNMIISNPPFSQKDRVLARLEELNKPYAMLLPINSLQGKKRFKLFFRIATFVF